MHNTDRLATNNCDAYESCIMTKPRTINSTPLYVLAAHERNSPARTKTEQSGNDKDRARTGPRTTSQSKPHESKPNPNQRTHSRSPVLSPSPECQCKQQPERHLRLRLSSPVRRPGSKIRTRRGAAQSRLATGGGSLASAAAQGRGSARRQTATLYFAVNSIGLMCVSCAVFIVASANNGRRRGGSS